ncbi:hypothetical protein H2198_004648 [Neophaeococcomyces mojaviensis]|uniref:Uncharacterized protein n=1 Tax=Neophaeococcomyces mojaviensis TaxID=3383035 RepID=A0ACC3A7X3_9EURO|nr:hypothetical protein H2198_004648 [Knufia sp. JES_112]
MSEIKQTNPSHELNLLISGAGVAGLTAAHFLLRAGHKVTIIEHAQTIRASGQNVDVRGHALTILKQMTALSFDAYAAVQAKITKEKGLRFVDANDAVWAEFPVDDGTSFTGEIEIMRGDLANVLCDSIKDSPGLEMLFERRITGIEETGNGVKVRMDDESVKEADLLIVAEGIGSATRTILFGDGANDVVKPLGQWSCWFSIPYEETDSEWARWYNATKGRMILIRPDRQNGGLTRVSLWTMTRDFEVEKTLNSLVRAGPAEQKQYWSKLFHGAGWEAPRVLQAMEKAPDFYMQKVAQVKIDTWSKGPAVLVGDAACCPSPISGMGVTNAMVGAYVLAGEINRSPGDFSVALKAYEDKMRPFVKIAQQLAPGTPGAANPEGAWGIWALHCFLGLIAWIKLYKLLGSSVNPPSQAMQLPNYGSQIVT